MFGNCAMVARFSALARETGRNPMVSRFKTTDESPAQCPWACNASLPSFQWQARIANVSGGPEPSQPTRCYLAGLFDTTVKPQSLVTTPGRIGAWSDVGNFSTGGETPRNFGLDPSGRFLLAENQKSGTIHILRINRRTGELKPTGSVVKVPSPVCVKMLAVDQGN